VRAPRADARARSTLARVRSAAGSSSLAPRGRQRDRQTAAPVTLPRGSHNSHENLFSQGELPLQTAASTLLATPEQLPKALLRRGNTHSCYATVSSRARRGEPRGRADLRRNRTGPRRDRARARGERGAQLLLSVKISPNSPGARSPSNMPPFPAFLLTRFLLPTQMRMQALETLITPTAFAKHLPRKETPLPLCGAARPLPAPVHADPFPSRAGFRTCPRMPPPALPTGVHLAPTAPSRPRPQQPQRSGTARGRAEGTPGRRWEAAVLKGDKLHPPPPGRAKSRCCLPGLSWRTPPARRGCRQAGCRWPTHPPCPCQDLRAVGLTRQRPGLTPSRALALISRQSHAVCYGKKSVVTKRTPALPQPAGDAAAASVRF